MDALRHETALAKFADEYVKSLEAGEPNMTPDELKARIIRIEETINRLYSIGAIYYSPDENGNPRKVVDKAKAEAIAAWAKKKDTPKGYRNLYRQKN